MESAVLEKIVDYAYTGKFDFSSLASSFIRTSLLPGTFVTAQGRVWGLGSKSEQVGGCPDPLGQTPNLAVGVQPSCVYPGLGGKGLPPRGGQTHGLGKPMGWANPGVGKPSVVRRPPPRSSPAPDSEFLAGVKRCRFLC